MFCKNCGVEIPDDSKFCYKCGKKTDIGIRVGNDTRKNAINNVVKSIIALEKKKSELTGFNEPIVIKLKSMLNAGYDVETETDINVFISNAYYGDESKMNHANKLLDKGVITRDEYNEIIRLFTNSNPEVAREKRYPAYPYVSPKQLYKANKINGIVSCPKCGSTSITSTNKKLSVKRGAVGAVLGTIVPGVGNAVGAAAGAVAGGLSSKKVYNVCMNCGHRWKP